MVGIHLRKRKNCPNIGVHFFRKTFVVIFRIDYYGRPCLGKGRVPVMEEVASG